ncbi:D-amino-acid oxidase [Fusarium oxysporum f. sp. albedinis]|nr:D-amino-acid oxidase [Fusarium oxysporum f. sp. albedinis]
MVMTETPSTVRYLLSSRLAHFHRQYISLKLISRPSLRSCLHLDFVIAYHLIPYRNKPNPRKSPYCCVGMLTAAYRAALRHKGQSCR